MATWTQILDEDWSSYGTVIADVAAAYPHPDESVFPMGASGVTVGPTIGPDGGPGLVDNASSASAQVFAHPLDVPCRGMRVQRRLDLTSWTSGVPVIAEGWWAQSTVPGEYDGSTLLWWVTASREASGSHGIQVNAERMTGSDYNSGTQLVLPRTGAFDILVEVFWSTVTGSFGSYAAAADGYISVSVDGVEVFNTGLMEIAYSPTDVLDWNGDPIDSNPDPYDNLTAMTAFGSSGRWQVWVDTSCQISATRNNFLTGATHTGRRILNSAIFGEAGTLQEKERVVLMALSDAFEWDGENGCLVVKGNLHLFGQLILHGGTLATGGLPIQMDPDEHALSLAGYAPTITGGPLGPAPAPDALAFTGLAPTLVRAHRASMSAGSIGITGRAPTVTVA
jgi:hypothetical protein